MLPKTPMLATAMDWSGPTSSEAKCCRFATICGACPTRSTWNPSPASRAWSSVRKLVELVLEVRGVVDELVDRRDQGGRRLHQDRQQHDHDREVDDDHGADLRQARDQPGQPVDQRQQGERQQPGEEEQQQDVAERVEHGGEVPEHDEPEGDHREDERGVDQPPLAFRQAVGHAASLHVATCAGHACDQWVAPASAGGATRTPGTIGSPTTISPSTRMSARSPALCESARRIGRPTRPSR